LTAPARPVVLPLANAGGSRRHNREGVSLSPVTHRSSARDFDCLLGSWTIDNLWLGAGGDWHRFRSTAIVTRHLDGLVLVDEYDMPSFPTRGHVKALNIRAFDEETAQWQLVWLASYCPPDFRPVVGAWTSPDEGEFLQTLVLADGASVAVRFRYTRLAADHVHWEQAMSHDHGETWATDWTMDFHRRAPR